MKCLYGSIYVVYVTSQKQQRDERDELVKVQGDRSRQFGHRRILRLLLYTSNMHICVS